MSTYKGCWVVDTGERPFEPLELTKLLWEYYKEGEGKVEFLTEESGSVASKTGVHVNCTVYKPKMGLLADKACSVDDDTRYLEVSTLGTLAIQDPHRAGGLAYYGVQFLVSGGCAADTDRLEQAVERVNNRGLRL